MIVLPDLSEEFETISRERFRPLRVELPAMDWAWLRRAAAICAAVALFLAAAGLWAFPAPDQAVVLIKLGASLAMGAGGAALLGMVETETGMARVQLDLGRGEIRTYERAPTGGITLTGRHDLAAMAEISLHNGTFFARSAEGRFAVSIPVRGRAKERAIRAALRLS